MKKLLMLAMLFVAVPVFAQGGVSSVSDAEAVDGTVVDSTVYSYDQMVVPGQPVYPTLMYPNLSQDVMLKAAMEITKQEVVNAYGDGMIAKLDGAIARILAKAKTVAKTKEGQAYFLGEITNKVMMVQQQFYNSSNPILHVLNYIGYAISLETMNTLYGDMGKDVDGLIEWIEGNKE